MTARLDAQTRRFLEEANVAVLATVSVRGRPQATPVWFMLDGEHILINTSKHRVKLRNLRRQPYAALTIVDPKDPYRWIQIQARVSRIDPASGARDIDRLSTRYLGRPYPYFSGDRPEDRVSVLLDPLRVTGMPG
jgi:PPOX class probable F420-dependent enzyme